MNPLGCAIYVQSYDLSRWRLAGLQWLRLGRLCRHRSGFVTHFNAGQDVSEIGFLFERFGLFEFPTHEVGERVNPFRRESDLLRHLDGDALK